MAFWIIFYQNQYRLGWELFCENACTILPDNTHDTTIFQPSKTIQCHPHSHYENKFSLVFWKSMTNGIGRQFWHQYWWNNSWNEIGYHKNWRPIELVINYYSIPFHFTIFSPKSLILNTWIMRLKVFYKWFKMKIMIHWSRVRTRQMSLFSF